MTTFQRSFKKWVAQFLTDVSLLLSFPEHKWSSSLASEELSSTSLWYARLVLRCRLEFSAVLFKKWISAAQSLTWNLRLSFLFSFLPVKLLGNHSAVVYSL